MSSAWYVGLTLAALAGSTGLAARIVERRALRDDECVDDGCCGATQPDDALVTAQRSSRAASAAQ